MVNVSVISTPVSIKNKHIICAVWFCGSPASFASWSIIQPFIAGPNVSWTISDTCANVPPPVLSTYEQTSPHNTMSCIFSTKLSNGFSQLCTHFGTKTIQSATSFSEQLWPLFTNNIIKLPFFNPATSRLRVLTHQPNAGSKAPLGCC